jgi:hypothetical protein
LAAGRFVKQKLQEDHGEKDLLQAIRRLEEYRAEQKAKWAAEAKAAPAVLSAKSRTKLIRKPKLKSVDHMLAKPATASQRLCGWL